MAKYKANNIAACQSSNLPQCRITPCNNVQAMEAYVECVKGLTADRCSYKEPDNSVEDPGVGEGGEQACQQ